MVYVDKIQDLVVHYVHMSVFDGGNASCFTESTGNHPTDYRSRLST